MTLRRLLTLATMCVLMAWPSIMFACEGCKSSAQDAGGPNAIGQAFGLSIYFMLAVPMIIMAIMVRAIVRRCREMDQENAHLFPPVAPVREMETWRASARPFRSADLRPRVAGDRARNAAS